MWDPRVSTKFHDGGESGKKFPQLTFFRSAETKMPALRRTHHLFPLPFIITTPPSTHAFVRGSIELALSPSTMPPNSPILLAQHIPTTLFILTTVLTASLINRTQPEPYIDEIFHIPQAQRFCSVLFSPSNASTWERLRNVEYDEKLTTPPGLYAISVMLSKVMPGWKCDEVVWLRATNLVLLLTLPVLVARVLRQNEELPSVEGKSKGREEKEKPVSRRQIKELQERAKREGRTPSRLDDPPAYTEATTTQPKRSTAGVLPRKPLRPSPSAYVTAVASTICFLPPLWFFGFLYYTDLASIWLVLAAISLYNDLNSSKHSLVTAVTLSVVSILAVLVRQTNLVWIAFAAARATFSQLDLGKRGLWGELKHLASAVRGRKFWQVLAKNAAPVVPMLVGCGWFVRWNGSIVLGDKNNHQAGMHFPQLGYFLAFATAFGFFPLIYTLSGSTSSVKSALNPVLKSCFGSPFSIASFGIVLALFWLAVERFTIDHPFLLADNRHYTFYIWRIFRRSYTLPFIPFTVEPRYAVVPLYALALFAWSSAITHRKGALFVVLYWGATAATLVPTPLVEPRYYLIPYLLLRIYSHREEARGKGRTRWVYLGAELATHALVNAVTVGLFVGRTFEWDVNAVDRSRNEGTLMRFIW